MRSIVCAPVRFLICFLCAVFLIAGTFARARAQQGIDIKGERSVSFAPWDTASIYKLIRKGHKLILDSPDSAAVFFEQARMLSIRQHFPDGIASALMGLGHCYMEKGNNNAFYELVKSAEPYAKNAVYRRTHLTAVWQKNMGIAYSKKGYGDSAILHLQQALDEFTRLGRISSQIGVLGDISAALISISRYEEALYHLKRAEELATSVNDDSSSLYRVYVELSNVYGSIKDTLKQYFYAQKVLTAGIRTGNTRMQRYAYYNMINYHIARQEPEQAILYARNAIALSDSQDHIYLGNANWGLSLAYYQLNDLVRAKEYGVASLRHFNRIDADNRVLAYLYEHLATVFFAGRDGMQAYQYHVKYASLLGKLNDIARNKAIDNLEAKYRIAEQEKQLLIQKDRVRNRNIWIVVSCCGVLVAIAVSILLLSLYRGSRRKMYVMEQQKEINELKALMKGEEKERSRIAKELHDGVGGLLSAATLNLNAMKEENVPVPQSTAYPKVQALIREISNEVRKTAHNLMPDVLLRYNLQEAIRMFCSYVRHDTRLHITVQTRGSFDGLDPHFCLTIYRIVQELVQNILKHAAATTAFVQLQRSGDLFTLTVEDNGKGFDVEGNPLGLGIKNIRERITVYNGTASIRSERDKGTSVYIELEVPDFK